MRIDVWSDVACPWCFIGKRRFERALERFEHRDAVEVHWRSFQLDPSLPERYDGSEVEYLSERKGMPLEQVRQMTEHVAAQAAGEGLHYDFDALVVANSLRAHQLVHLAKRHGVADAVEEALFSAHFEDGVDIGDVDALALLGAQAGLDEDEVRAALADERYLADVRADIATATQLGITGVPCFVFDLSAGISGAQPSDVLLQAMRQLYAEQAAQPEA